MPRRRLRRILARAVFLAIGATQAGCCCPGPDPDIDVDYDRTSPEIAALIDRCDANRDDCVELCRAALEDEFGSDAVYYEVIDCRVTPKVQGPGVHVHVSYWDGSACGRAPDGLLACDANPPDPVARWLARAAYLEAASVVAFTHLAADLVYHRAPRRLIAAAITAAHDEVRHAAILRTLLRGRAHVPAPRVPAYRRASLRDLALLNAIEGCARETVGAAVNLWQARRARDPDIRAAFAAIARDECAHAELSWAIHAWAVRRLGATDAEAVLAAHHAALDNLVAVEADDATREVLGLPSDRATRVLVAFTARAFDTRRRDRPTHRAPDRSS